MTLICKTNSYTYIVHLYSFRKFQLKMNTFVSVSFHDVSIEQIDLVQPIIGYVMSHHQNHNRQHSSYNFIKQTYESINQTIKTTQSISKQDDKQSKLHYQHQEKNVMFLSQLQAQKKEVNLQQLYPKDKLGTMSVSKLTYYHSLVPKISSLRQGKKIQFCVGLTQQRPKVRLLPENSVNIHLFNPFYVEEEAKILCYVSTQEIMKHSLASLFQILHHHSLSHPTITYSCKKQSICDIIKHWSINQTVIVCRVESLLTYLLIEWLKEISVPLSIIKTIAVEIENSRLNQKYPNFDKCLEEVLKAYGLSKSTFYNRYDVQRQSSASIFLYGFNFVYRGVEITAVMLPWGLDLAQRLMKALIAINPKIKRVGMVGGVGYVGEQSCEVDDIFVPKTMLIGDQTSHRIERVENGITDSPEAVHFANHTTVEGCLKSVFPQFGKLSNIATYRNILHKIDALDMQFQAIYRFVRGHGAEIGAIFYIMNLPKKDIHLGDTYYSLEFLEKLFKKFDRGKHHCFERTLLYLSN